MSEPIEMMSTKIAVNRADKINLIKDRDYKFEYGCAVKIGRADIFKKTPTNNSYSITISVNQEIEDLEKENKELKEDLHRMIKATNPFLNKNSDEVNDLRAEIYYKYFEVSKEENKCCYQNNNEKECKCYWCAT